MLQAVRGHHIWPAPLQRGSVVVDAGAHHGEFSAELMEHHGCRCILVEANPNLAAALRIPNAQVFSAALAAQDGYTTFQAQANPEAGSITTHRAPVSKPAVGMPDASDRADLGIGGAKTVQIETISLPLLMRRCQIENLDLLKLDIEGAEFDLIEQTPDDVWLRVSQITVEFHDFLPRFAGRGLFKRARTRLEKLGFLCCLMSFRTHGDVLFLNQRRLKLGMNQTFYSSHVARWFQKAKALSARK